jgi:hypothetical protein
LVQAFFFYLLYTHREAIRNRPVEADDDDDGLDPSIEFMRPSFDSYKGAFWYYEVVDMSVRVVYAALQHVLGGSPPTLLLTLLVISLAWGVQLYRCATLWLPGRV